MWLNSTVGRFHSLYLNQCAGGLGRFLSKELNQGSWDFKSLYLPAKEIWGSKAVWATLKKGTLHLEICKKKTLEIWKDHGILLLRKSGNPVFCCCCCFFFCVVTISLFCEATGTLCFRLKLIDSTHSFSSQGGCTITCTLLLNGSLGVSSGQAGARTTNLSQCRARVLSILPRRPAVWSKVLSDKEMVTMDKLTGWFLFSFSMRVTHRATLNRTNYIEPYERLVKYTAMYLYGVTLQ